MDVFIPVYVATVALVALTIGWAASLAKRSGQKLHRVFFYFVIVNDLVGLSDILFKFLPARIGSSIGGGGLMAGFLVFPLMAAFSVLIIDVLLTLAERPFSGLLKKACIGYWGLLFIGFLAAEFRLFVHKDWSLTDRLMPFFNWAIVLSGVGSALFVLLRGPAVPDLRQRRFVRGLSGYFLGFFLVFAGLYFGPRWLGREWDILVRSLLAFVYLLPPLAMLNVRLKETRNALLTRLAGAGAALERWLESRNLSPREREIAARILEGKSNQTIEKELFIGRRTIESHLYNIYRKLGVKSRLQMARLAASEMEREPLNSNRPETRARRTGNGA